MERKEGWYWVKFDGKWEIAKVDDWGYFHCIDDPLPHTYIVFEEINETPITPPNN